MIVTRLRWLCRSKDYKVQLAYEACQTLGRGTLGYYLYSELVYAIEEGLALDCEDYELMDVAQRQRDLRTKITKLNNFSAKAVARHDGQARDMEESHADGWR